MDWRRHNNLLTEWELVYVHVNCVRAQHRLIWAEQSLGNLFPAPAARGVRPMALVTRGMPERWIFSSEGLLLSTWKNFSSSPLMNGLQPWCNQIHLKIVQDDELKILVQSNLSILMTHTHFSSLSSLVSWEYDENMSVRRDNLCSQSWDIVVGMWWVIVTAPGMEVVSLRSLSGPVTFHQIGETRRDC